MIFADIGDMMDQVLQCILSSSFVTATFYSLSEMLAEFSIIKFLKRLSP